MAAVTFGNKPYIEIRSKHLIIRKFKKDIDPMLLIWHEDELPRNIKIIEGVDWKLQFDNHRPFVVEMSKCYYIPPHTIHRIHKGINDLIIEIKEVI